MKKAFAWLEGNGIEYTFHDYKKLGTPDQRIKVWIQRAGWERVLNTKGKTFRDLPTARKLDLNAAKAAVLASEFPSAIKRPVLETSSTIVLGFNADEYQFALK